MLVMSWAWTKPVLATCAVTLSLGSGPGIPKAMHISQLSSSMSFLHATGRSFIPGTVTRISFNPVVLDLSSFIASDAMSCLAKVVSASPIFIIFPSLSDRSLGGIHFKYTSHIKKAMVSERLSQLRPSPTLEITAKAKALKAQGVDVIGFGAGEPDFDTPRHIKDALYQAVDEGFIYYTPSPGIPELRQAISEKLKHENGIDYASDEVIVTPGAKQALFEAVMALVNPGDEVLIPAPYWVSYVPMCQIAGARAVPVATSSEQGFRVSAEYLAASITERTRLLILNSPSNPTGAVLDRNCLSEIADLCIKEDITVISDEIYEQIIYDAEHVSIGSLPEMRERTVTVNGFSKAYSMTGWRLGYAAAPREIIKLMSNLQGHSVSNATSFVQKAGVAALRGSQDCVAGMTAEFRRRRDRIVELLNEIPGVECLVPDGAFYVFADFSGVEADSMKLAGMLLDEAGVAVVPGVAFGDAGEGFQRLSYAIGMKKIEEGIARIDKVVRRMR